MKPENVLVLGASGFIGKAVIAELASLGVARIGAVARHLTPESFAAYPTVESITTDVTDRRSLSSTVQGFSTVISCYRERMNEQISARAIDNILEACVANSVKKLIYLSSIAIYGSAQGIVDEDTAPVEPVSRYGRTKRHAEHACEAKASEALRIAILRPSLVYGPGGDEWSLRFIRRIQAKGFLELGPEGEGTANLVFVADLARFCVRLASEPIPRISICNVNGHSPPSFNEYFREIALALGISASSAKPRAAALRKVGALCRRLARYSLKFPRRALRSAADRDGSLDRFFERMEVALRYSPEEDISRNHRRKVVYSTARAEAMGFEPKTSLREAVSMSVKSAG
jgi:nucleoside-diphosphate-sugar epimerase